MKNLVFFSLMFLLAACTQEDAVQTSAMTNLSADEEDVFVEEASADRSAQQVPETAVPAVEAVEVTYYTPAQQEGPYYPVHKPEDRDNDLTDFAGASGNPAGQLLEFGGVVYDAHGLPVKDVLIEIWQTDASGVYLHPDDPGTASRDPNFQFYGESTTDESGSYRFRTILPGRYEPRPPHIHFKVMLDGKELLTSQFYFSDVPDLQGADAALLITTEPGQDAAGNSILKGKRDIILNHALSN